MGGPVRDALLGRPVKDLDFSVEGDAPALAQRLAAELAGQTIVHPRFGTATVVADGLRIDLVTARCETYAHPGALPRVTPSDIRHDLARRDFSINAMAIPLAGDPSLVLDHWGGLEDLRLGVVRTLHNGSFTDDPTRVFRAVRYEQRLGFRIDEQTLGQLKDAVDQGRLAALSPDRLRHELERILEEENPGLALARCLELGVLQALHPALNNLDKLERLNVSTGETKTGREAAVSPQLPMVYLAALVSALSEQEGEELISRLNMPETWRRVVRDTIRLQAMADELNDDSLPPSRLVHLLENISVEAVTALGVTSEKVAVNQGLHRFLMELRHIGPGLDGRDLLQLGVPPGPLVGRILSRLRDAVLDGRLDGGAGTDAGRRCLVRRLLKESMAEAIGNSAGAEAFEDAGHG